MRPRLRQASALISVALAGVIASACQRHPDRAPSPAPVAEAQGPSPASATLERVRARKRLKCGVTDGLPGFAERGLTGWRGFDVDLCRAVAAAAPPAKTIADLNGLRICVQGGSPAQQALAEGLKARGLSYQPIVKDDRRQALEAYEKRECDAVTDDLSVLAYDHGALRDPDRHVILAETLADDPAGPMVREGDDRWANVVRWTLNALILAEAAKVDSRTVDQARTDSVNPELRRLLGLEGDTGRRLGLAPDWAYRAVRQVGSYGEVFDRNLGPGSPLKLERGRNALWTADKPGLLYSPPLR